MKRTTPDNCHRDEPAKRTKSHQICNVDGCETRAYFNIEGSTHGRFCAQHKEANMIDVKSKRCEAIECTSLNPVFNIEGSRQGRFCRKHKEPNMVDVKSKRCESIGCTSLNPVFNIEGASTGRFCAKHKETDMVDIKNKRCESSGCTAQPVFNIEGASNGRFCRKHKETDMVDIKNKRCESTECTAQPIFNIEGSTHGRFCAKHKEVNMVDIKSKRCSLKECKTRARFGFPGAAASSCKVHLEIGMILCPKTRCTEQNCREFAIFGLTKPNHCEFHKEPIEENLALRKCKTPTCGALEICNEDGFCFEYCINSEYFKRWRLLKQKETLQMLSTLIMHAVYSDDKTIDTACNKRRPDRVYDCGIYFLVLEIDEHQHRGYDKSCEYARQIEILQAFGMPVLFIRYNPDTFNDKNGIKSMILKAKRHDVLKRWVETCLESPPKDNSEYLRCLYLFYDGFDLNAAKIENIALPVGF